MAKKSNSGHHSSIVGGVVLVVLGLLFIIQDYLHIDIIDRFWPLILVAAGIVLIYNARRS